MIIKMIAMFYKNDFFKYKKIIIIISCNILLLNTIYLSNCSITSHFRKISLFCNFNRKFLQIMTCYGNLINDSVSKKPQEIITFIFVHFC